ncbi:MAG: DNA polymerase IV [Candidatus Hydrogenedentota bacterium]
MKRILHVDMDAFFASVEQARNPALMGKPVIVGGKPGDKRGVVSTASYEARKFGVHSAMPIVQAVKRCPQGIFVRGNSKLYSEISARIKNILGEVSPLLEMASIDEAYIDITGSIRLFGDEDAIASHLKEHIYRETGLKCTIGISSNRMISKVASGLDKPDGYLRIVAGEERAFLNPIEVGRIPGIGPKLTARLKREGIHTVGDLGALSLDTLMARYGDTGVSLHRIAQGMGGDGITRERVPKSIGRETTFAEDVADWAIVEATLRGLFERTVHAMRMKGIEGRCVTLKMRSPDFTTHTYSHTMENATSLEPDIWVVVKSLLKKARAQCDSVRLVGVQLSRLTTNQHQLLMDESGAALQWEDAMASVDIIRERFGSRALQSGKSLGMKIQAPGRISDPE